MARLGRAGLRPSVFSLQGDDLAALMHIQPGPMFKTLLQRQIEYQLENPTATKEQVQEWLRTLDPGKAT